MPRRTTRVFSLMCIFIILFSGCQYNNRSTVATTTQHWTTWPQLNYGTMESDKLKAESWDFGRAEATYKNRIAETEHGYYLLFDNFLHYADKADLGTWVPVCNRPDCKHSYDYSNTCNAFYSTTEFIVKQERIYFLEDPSYYPELSSYRSGFAVFSRALDGTNLKLEYIDEDMLSSGTGGGEGFNFLTQTYWVHNSAQMNTDGSYELTCFIVTDNGTECLVKETVEEYTSGTMISLKRIAGTIDGEPSFNHLFLGDKPYMECRYQDGSLYFADLTGYYEEGRYLSGNTLRLYRKNDGYYDVDLETKEEVKVGNVHIENAESFIYLPNCIIESTLFKSTHDTLNTNTQHRMALFDGQNWHEVQLPEELLEPGYKKYLIKSSVTSDSVFFLYREESGLHQKIHLYRIPIQDGKLALEYCGRIK